MLSVKDLTLKYGQSQILFGVNLDARQGEISGVMGNNGVGKSSLLKAISGRHPFAAGTVAVDGQTVKLSSAYHAARAGIAYVPQGVEMFIESVDNSACIQLYNSNPNRTAPVLRPDCIAKDVGDFYFGGDFDWSCDGNSLIVTGNFDTSGDWGIHRIDNIFDTGDLNLTDNIASLVTVDSNTDVPNSPASRCTP